MSKITRGAAYCIGTHGTGYRSYNSKTFIMFNCHKVRRKRIRASHWVAYVYEFDEGLLKGLGIKVVQNPRNFEVHGKIVVYILVRECYNNFINSRRIQKMIKLLGLSVIVGIIGFQVMTSGSLEQDVKAGDKDLYCLYRWYSEEN